MSKEWPHLTGLQDILSKSNQAVPVNCVFPSSQALDSAIPWLESFGNSVLHCLHPFDIEISKTIQLSQNISTFYMGSTMIIFQFYENNHWSCQQQHRNSRTATHVCVLITFWSGKTNDIADGFTGRRGFDQQMHCAEADWIAPSQAVFTPSLLWQSHHPFWVVNVQMEYLDLCSFCIFVVSPCIHFKFPDLVCLALYSPANLEKCCLLLFT